MLVSELLSGPEKWTQGQFARDEDDFPCGACDGNACKWCINGAAKRCFGKIDLTHAFFKCLYNVIGTSGFVQWNDAPRRTFDEVRAAVLETERRMESGVSQ